MGCDFHWDKSFQYPGEFSRGLDIVRAFVGRYGFTLKVGKTRAANVAGTINFKRRTIVLSDKIVCAGCWLVTALHEAGHMLHFLNYGKAVKRSKDVLERVAENYAKRLSEALKINIVDAKEWEEHEKTSKYLCCLVRQHRLQKEYAKIRKGARYAKNKDICKLVIC